MRLGLAGLALLLAISTATPAAPTTTVVESDHYRLEAQTPKAGAEEMLRVLEAAWPRFLAFFGAEPELGEGEKLTVFFGADRASFEARLRADGAAVPKSGGYYSPKTKIAYLWRQPTRYYTRCLLIHEASHQFHYLARTKNRHVRVEWYVEGLAEYLSRHAWDGKTLQLGVVPTISLKDYPAAARKRFAEEEGLLDSVFSGEEKDRAAYWAVVRFLLTTDDARLRKRFRTLMSKFDKGGSSLSLARRTLGSSEKIEKALSTWLEREQEPWRQIYNEWEGIGPGRIEGTAPSPIVTACAVKADAKRLAAALEVPETGAWIGGLLLHHVSRDDYTTAMVHGGEFLVLRRQDGRWVTMAGKPCPEPKDGLLHLLASRQGDRVAVFVEGEEIGTFELPGATLGLALQGCTLRYREVSWE